MLRTVLLSCALASPALAQGISVAVLDATNVSDTSVKRLQRATEAALKLVGGLGVSEGAPFKKGAPKKCSPDECARELVTAASSSAVVLLELRGAEGKGDRVAIDLQLWVDGEKVGSKRGEGTVDGFETAIKPVIEGLLPAWARKGFGGLRVDVEEGSVVKVDGRLVSSKGDVVSLPAGVHQVDVVFPEGHAVLQRTQVPEGERVKLTPTSPSSFVTGAAPLGTSALRGVSYGVFVAGSASVAGGLVAGALGRGTSAGLVPCQLDTRDCAPLDTVLEKQKQAAAYATTGNVMLGVGTGLVVTGVALFLIDVLTH